MKFVSAVVFCLTALQGFSQVVSVQDYIDQYKDLAIREMKRMGVPAAITLAQGLLETQNGNSDLLKKSNNHFGIKCKSSWTAEGVSHDDDAPGECFRVYKNAEESYRDHSNFLRGSERYAFLFELDPRDYKAWARGLRQAGYATNPKYPEILIRNIENYNLEQYTILAANEVPDFDASKYTAQAESEQLGLTGGAEPDDLHNYGNSKINGSKIIIAEKGTSLLAIATNNNLSLHKLLEFNELETDGLLKNDAIIFLEKKAKKGDQEFYISNRSETLRDISQKTGVQLQSICEYNSLQKNDLVRSGTKIYLRPAVIQEEPHQQTAILSPSKIHKVGPREGLYSISKKYNVTVEQLREWNGLENDNLAVGQELIISQQ